MHWSRVKTILIFLFLALDIYMLAYAVYMNYDPYSTARSEIKDIVSIYKANNLTVDERIIPEKTGRLGIVELNNLWADKSEIAKRFFKDGYIRTGTGSFSSGGETLEFFDDMFVYKNNAHREGTGDLREFLNQMGIYTDDSCPNGGTVRQKIGGMSVFETAVTAKGGETGISEMSGYWIISDERNTAFKKQVKLKPISGVLIDFLATDVYNKNGDKIISIETGYSTGSASGDTVYKLVSVVPAYKITTESGGYAVFDATEGVLLYQVSK